MPPVYGCCGEAAARAAADRVYGSPRAILLAGRTNKNPEHDREHAKCAGIQFVDVIQDAHADLIGSQRGPPIDVSNGILESRPNKTDGRLPLGTAMCGAGQMPPAGRQIMVEGCK
jgi:hypothetical protein